MSTKLLTSGLTIYNLKQEYNGKEVSVNPSDGDVYIIDNTSQDKSECERWAIREVSGEIICDIDSYDNEELQLSKIVDATLIRLREVVKAYDSNDEYLGSLVVNSIDEVTGLIGWGYAGGSLKDTSGTNVVEFDMADLVYIELQTDELLTDGQSLTIESSNFPYLCVSGTCKFTITTLGSGILGKK